MPPFFAWLEANWRAVAAGWPEREHAIAVACRAKAAAVAADERDEGGAAPCSIFGHTFAHALEAATGYSDRLVHGEAVAIGMVLAHRFSARLSLAPAGRRRPRRRATSPKSACRPHINDIPGERPDVETLMRHIAQDKKVERGSLTFILTRGIGQAFIAHDVAPGEVVAFLKSQLGK